MSLREIAASLDDATTWFFERACFDFPCTLTIRLAEGRPAPVARSFSAMA